MRRHPLKVSTRLTLAFGLLLLLPTTIAAIGMFNAAALVEQSAAAAESLRNQAAQRVQTVAIFRLTDHRD